MKIMMVITGMKSGGAERVMATLCNELSKANEVRLLILKNSTTDYQLSEKVDIVTANINSKIKIIKGIKFIGKQIDEWTPDTVLAFMNKANIATLLGARYAKKNVPIIIAERANPYYAPFFIKILRRVLYPRADGCVFQTKQAQKYYINILRCESAILKNPLNPEFKVEKYSGKKKNKIVCVGRLSKEKNQKLLIDAFSKISIKYPEYTLEFYGDGPLYNDLEKYIQKRNLQEKVLLKGRKDNIQEHINDSKIFVLPSDSEGMPNALIEAMSLGLTCISTDCPIGRTS